MNKHYCTEKNILILIALLKANGIRKVVASPGTTNYSLVGSLQSDPFFEIYSSVDERSAAFIACGLAAESGEPVMLTCTGSTASRNYYPGMTEAYYHKLPVLAVTSHQGLDRIGQLVSQNLDRRQIAKDAALLSVELPVVKDARDEAYVTMEVNKAILELRRNGGGPVHIDIFTTYSNDFSVEDLPKVRAMKRFFSYSEFPDIPQGGTKAVFIGCHTKFSDEETKAIDSFCAKYDGVVICDHTSGYYGAYKLMPAMAIQQHNASSPLPKFDLVLHIGEVSAAEYSNIQMGEVWRISRDGELRDPFKKLTNVFQMSELEFFCHYASDGGNHTELYDRCILGIKQLFSRLPELPFSNLWSTSIVSQKLPKGSLLHLSASNTRRCWNMFWLPEGVESASNVGCCGIDGSTSTLIGASLADPNRLCFLATGDLAFFYDLNSLGNRHVGNNVRILLVNNGVGTEFKLRSHKCFAFGDEANNYMAAAGHYGNKSPELIKHYAQDLGFKYLSASNKEEYLAVVDEFVDVNYKERPIVFEIFTDYHDEDEAISIIRNFDVDTKHKVANVIRSVAGETGLKVIRKVIGK